MEFFGGRGKGGDWGGRRRVGWVVAKDFQTRTLSSADWMRWVQRWLVSLAGRVDRLVGVRLELRRKLGIWGGATVSYLVFHCVGFYNSRSFFAERGS